MRATGLMLIAACAVPPLGADMADAHPVRQRHTAHHVVRIEPAPPSQDAVELATLAPPAPRSTIEQSYGDAGYARGRLERRVEGERRADRADAAAYGSTPYPCEPRIAATSATICNGAPHTRSYGQGYAFTPSFVSAPQRLGVPPDEQSGTLPPLTGLAWIVNNLRYDPHN